MILENVLEQLYKFDNYKITKNDIKNALNKDILDFKDLRALLSEEALEFLEDIAQKAQKLTRKYFGNGIYLFTPLYLSNYCNSKCVYCGFQSGNNIVRAKLDEKEIKNQMEQISKSSLEEILLLTGEGREYASAEYIAKACDIARDYFKVVGVEVYSMDVNEYELLHKSGCDYVTMFQETYNKQKYSKIHLAGEKRNYEYRFNAQERALKAGMRGVAFGSLLGIDDFRKDAYATALHAYFIQKKYPHAEISLSVPRLRPIINNKKINPKDVNETRLLQIMCVYRLFLPFANITISSRESVKFRNNVIKICANKMSAGVNVGVANKGDEQFIIDDNRSVGEILKMLKEQNLQAIMSDSIYAG